MNARDIHRASDLIAADPPKRRVLGLFGVIDWFAVIAILVEIVLRILRRDGYLSPYAHDLAGDRLPELPAGWRDRIDREYPL